MRAHLYLLIVFAILLQATSCAWIWMGFELNKDYITTQLCINRFEPAVTCSGFCYVEKQVEMERGQTDASAKVKQIDLHIYFPLTYFGVEATSYTTESSKMHLFFDNYIVLVGIERYIFKPPIMFFV